MAAECGGKQGIGLGQLAAFCQQRRQTDGGAHVAGMLCERAAEARLGVPDIPGTSRQPRRKLRVPGLLAREFGSLQHLVTRQIGIIRLIQSRQCSQSLRPQRRRRIRDLRRREQVSASGICRSLAIAAA